MLLTGLNNVSEPLAKISSAKTHCYWKKYQFRTKVEISVMGISKIYPNKCPRDVKHQMAL